MSAGVWMRASAWSAAGQARGARQDRTRFREAEGAAGGGGGRGTVRTAAPLARAQTEENAVPA